MHTHQTAITQYVEVDGNKMAYRRIGTPTAGKLPLVMFIHFRGSMDYWDPALINALSKFREVILLDNAGTGESGGEVPESISGWADNYIGTIKAIGFTKIDLLGFSMGGCAAQQVALKEPTLVRKLILAGTRSAKRASTTNAPDVRPLVQLSEAAGSEEEELSLAASFHPTTPEGNAIARAVWLRYNERPNRTPFLGPEGTKRQLEAFQAFDREGDSVHKLSELTMPVLVANGDNDVLVPTINSWDFIVQLPNAYLHLYPNAGHGFLFQYAELFAAHVGLFLDGFGVNAKL